MRVLTYFYQCVIIHTYIYIYIYMHEVTIKKTKRLKHTGNPSLEGTYS